MNTLKRDTLEIHQNVSNGYLCVVRSWVILIFFILFVICQGFLNQNIIFTTRKKKVFFFFKQKLTQKEYFIKRHH